MVFESERKSRFIVGLDFGTTYTKVAFAHSSSPDIIELVREWPGFSSDQVPTILHYTDAARRESLWGYEIRGKPRECPEPLKWFKLLLLERFQPSSSPSDNPISNGDYTVMPKRGLSLLDPGSSPTPIPAARTAAKLQTLGVTASSVITDFLKHVRACTLTCMNTKYKAEFIACSKTEYVVTVPAMSSDAAKDTMVKALEEAGFGKHRIDFNLISEPEAAAAHTFKAIQPQSLEVGDCFVVCDAGGGTCDLISYRVESLIPMKLTECVSGAGDLCGSVYLDHRFEDYMRSKFGAKLIDSMPPGRRQKMLASWQEDVKHKFGNVINGEFDVNVPGMPDSEELDVFDGYHTITDDAVEDIFRPVVERIQQLVRSQCEKVQRKGFKVAAILLVGGFGSSKYLRDYLQAAFYGGQMVPVIQPANARTAIARGALLRGIDGSMVRARRSRLFYGTTYAEFYSPFTRPNHVPSDMAYYDRCHEAWYIDKKINWFIKKEDMVTPDTQCSIELLRAVPVPAGPDAKVPIIVEKKLVIYEQDTAPDYVWEAEKDDIRTVCTCISDLSNVDRSRFPIKTNSVGMKYYEVIFKIVVSRVNEVLQFGLYFEGERFGFATAKFE